MIVSWVASESIRNSNEIEDSNKKIRTKSYESDLIRPEIENQSKRYSIDLKINMWC